MATMAIMSLTLMLAMCTFLLPVTGQESSLEPMALRAGNGWAHWPHRPQWPLWPRCGWGEVYKQCVSSSCGEKSLHWDKNSLQKPWWPDDVVDGLLGYPIGHHHGGLQHYVVDGAKCTRGAQVQAAPRKGAPISASLNGLLAQRIAEVDVFVCEGFSGVNKEDA
ncbi:hypothetical protein MTO96_038442 [Rhipicephalus appendiculatus]